MAVDCLIFSKDRPAQLDLLLRSIERWAPGFYRGITIQATFSTPEYGLGYDRLRLRGGPLNLTWQWDSGPAAFAEMVRAWLRGDHDLISFLVDDNVFYGTPIFIDGLARAQMAVSYRGGDYDYPFSLDGCVYRTGDIRTLLAGLSYGDPTQVENAGYTHRGWLPFRELARGNPCVTGLPWNRVSTTPGGAPRRDFHEFDLNERFLNGERIKLPEFDRPMPPHTMDYDPEWERV